ncbi:Molting fluid carboxypeptidase A, partial [Operophtera brumata]
YNILVKVARKDARYQIWDVRCTTDGQRTFLKNLEIKGDSSMDIRVETQRAMQVEKMLKNRDIHLANIMDEVISLSGVKRMRSPVMLRKKSPSKKFMDWSDYHPLNIVYNFMDSLEIQFPSTCSVIVIGKSVEGRDIKVSRTYQLESSFVFYHQICRSCPLTARFFPISYLIAIYRTTYIYHLLTSSQMLKISNSDATNTGVWLDGAIHPREWISVSVVTYIANYFARQFNNLPKTITNKDWYFVPIVNPDGYHHTHTMDRMWRKNRARSGNTITGVDLNRNFGHFWGKNVSNSSSGDPYHLNYRGPEPFSEPETSAIKDIILYSGTPFKIFLTFHSHSEVIAFPWCFTPDSCADYVNLLEGGTAMAKAIYETSGRMYKVGNFKDIMYYACGTSIDWSYGTARIPFSYLVELRSKQSGFCLPKPEIIECCEEVLS